MIISFDFDDTLRLWDGTPCYNMIAHAHALIKDGHELVIVTARRQTFDNHIFIMDFLNTHEIKVKRVICVNHELKGPTLKEAKVEHHYDDSESHCISAVENGVRAFLVKDDSFQELV